MQQFSKKVIGFLSGLLFFFSAVIAQDPHDYQWWAEAHNWDGVTHWSRYIKRLPGYMGPNALPIPEMTKGKTDSVITFSTAFEYHSGKGEFALNPLFKLNIPIVKEKVALDFIYRPFEYYETEEFIRHERHGRSKDSKGFAKSDLYIATHIQLFNQRENFLDAQLRIALKTTTGKDLANARHTDAPGYFFDMNLGKTIYENHSFINKVLLSSMAGLYVWQMDFDNNRQNDAYLYGIEAHFSIPVFTISASFSGYSGYMDMRDKPMAMRYSISTKLSRTHLFYSYQQGLRDIISSSSRVGLQIKL